MKKILFFLILAASGFITQAQQTSVNPTDYAGYLGVKDTLTNADTSAYEVTISGAKSAISFQVNVIKLTGTVAGDIKVFGSVDGVTYVTAPITTVTVTDASVNYVVSYTSNLYKKYKLQTRTTGTSTASQRSYILYRK